MDLWDFLFVQLVSWRLHPGYLREGSHPPSIQEICALTDEIVAARNAWKDL